MSFLNGVIDERFLDRRRRSTSVAGIIGGVLALCLFEWRFLIDHVCDWYLLAVGLTFVAVKLTMMSWYYLTDQK
ncbi:MAG TPA: hypothetical protein VFP59_04760 [Candidatus Angelobacter sp.]|nr:hypothetical protein [Candidatus Angelobacter sp.]